MPLGLDTEWNTGPSGKVGKIQLLQLAIKEKLLHDEKCTELILLIVLKEGYQLPRYVSEILNSPKALKIGSRVVSSDFKYLHEDFGISARSSTSVDVCDVAHFCKRKGMVDKANTSLAKCCAAVLDFCLNKSDEIRRSDWSKSRLSKQQKEYAARDAWASLLIYLKLQNTPDRVFSLPIIPCRSSNKGTGHCQCR
ncbi:ribonuclease H-like domain-containing protein [Obelidium mucronatum]|nr:ribonuclease H-like domain-containing protein [Obelidium mucronatum]